MADDKERSARIAQLNDALRREPRLSHDQCVFTSGVAAEGPRFILAAMRAVETFNAFNAENDPYGEHDFGSFELDGYTVFWKIDYFEKGSNREAGAETPDNALTTDRVLTIMLAEEY